MHWGGCFGLAAGLLPAIGVATAGPVADLEPATRKPLVEAARAYLDPHVEFSWRPREALREQLDALAVRGLNAYRDLTVLKDVVYNGRHFLERFDDPGWRRRQGVTDFRTGRGVYRSVRSEPYRFTYTQPSAYPRQRDLDRAIPRDDPFPVLLVFHEERDTVDAQGQAEEYPGEVVLARRYAKDAFPELYERWFLLAPVAPRARFLAKEGDLRHEFSTHVLRELWQRYHVDFDRVVVDGGPEALAMVATFPHVFAGVVFRGGAIEREIVPNYAAVPAYVVGDRDAGRELEAAGHPNVAAGDDAGLRTWLAERRRQVPRSFRWNAVRADHGFPYWIEILRADFEAPRRTLDVEAIDTAAQPNTLRIDGVGIEEIALYLNDEIVDLDRDVTLVVNGEVRPQGRLDRTIDQLFESDPAVRSSMYFGWLYPTCISPVRVPPPASSAAAEPPAAAPRSWPGPEARLAAQQVFLLGRPDLLEQHLGSSRADLERSLTALAGPRVQASDAVEERARGLAARAEQLEAEGDLDRARGLWKELADLGPSSLRRRARLRLGEDPEATRAADLLYVLLLRDLWWRPLPEVVAPALAADLRDAAPPTLLAPYRWLLGGGVEAFPAPPLDEDPWPVISTLVLDRQWRETKGREGLPAQSPLATRPPPAPWADWYAEWLDRFLVDCLDRGLTGDLERGLSEDELAHQHDLDAQASSARQRNLTWALVLTGLFLLAALLLARPWARGSAG